jgi:hypothetical protein
VKHIGVLVLGLLLAGCNQTTKVFDKPVLVDRTELMVPPVQPVVQNDMSWIVITPENYSQKIEELSTKGNVVLFALTPQGYQTLAMNLAEMRKFIQSQNATVIAYKDYYKNRE